MPPNHWNIWTKACDPPLSQDLNSRKSSVSPVLQAYNFLRRSLVAEIGRFRISLIGGIHMPRVAFRLRIKSGKEQEYEEAHRHVWPALLAKLKEVGISKYSIFRRDQDLILVMQVADFDAAWDALDQDETNLRWQEEMSVLFEPVPGLKPGERFAMMKEVFYLD